MFARNGWTTRDVVRLVVALAAVFTVTWPAWSEMAQLALMNDYARPNVLVLPIMIWLIWVRRARFRFVRPGGTGIGWVVLIAGTQLYFMNEYMYDLRSPGHLGAVMMVAGAVLACTGKSLIKHFIPAWAILPFLVPVPVTLAQLIATPLQEFEANSIATLYGLIGIEVTVVTNQMPSLLIIGDNETKLTLGMVCKGLPTMMSLMLISYGFVFGSPMRPIVRAVLLLIAPLIALLCSALALGGTLWLYDGRSALMTADLIRALSEWVTLLIAFLLIAGALRLLSWASVPVHQYHLASTSS